jgi:glycosyltransferase involved in cell wall biosynthesis
VDTPLVSIIISVYNGEKYLPGCIEGINSQTYQNYEVYVVDDGSTDTTPTILGQWKNENDRVKIISKNRSGLTSGLNVALSQSEGSLIARHDADDISSSYRLEEQVMLMNSCPQTVLAGSWAVEFEDPDRATTQYKPPEANEFIVNSLLKGANPLVHGSIMFRKKAFLELGEGYRFRFAQDFDLYLRLMRKGNFYIIPKFLYALRRHADSISFQMSDQYIKIKELIMHVNSIYISLIDKNTLTEEYKKFNSWQQMEEYLFQNTVASHPGLMKARNYFGKIIDQLQRQQKISALKYTLAAIREAPFWWKSWLTLAFCSGAILAPQKALKLYHHRKPDFLSQYREPCSNHKVGDYLYSPAIVI